MTDQEIDEIVERYSWDKYGNFFYGSRADLINDFKRLFKYAKKHRWISVKERLPKCGAPKDPTCGWLVTDGADRWITYQQPSWWNTEKPDELGSDYITHWRPLPDLPKEE